MVITRTDLYVPELRTRSDRWWRVSVAHPAPAATPGGWRRILSGRLIAAVISAFARPERGERTSPRHHPVRRPDFVEGAALSREMFRL